MRISDKGLTAFEGSREAKDRLSSRLVIASLWLQVTALIFIALEIYRMQTPITDWVDKTLRLLSAR